MANANITNGTAHPNEIRDYLREEREAYRGGCGGRGYYHHFDTDYDCGGCAACDRFVRIGRNLAQIGKLQSTEELRARLEVALVAYEALQAIGKAIAAALAPGARVQAFIMGAVAEWKTVRKGRWYEVTGKRGNAKLVQGKIGQCMGVYTEERRSMYGTWSYGSTTKAALKIEGQEKLAYVTVGNLEPVTEPADAERARMEREAAAQRKAIERPAFPAHCAGRHGVRGCIVDGVHRGKSGKVFWHGVKNGEPRVGVKLCACKKRCSCEVAWCSARDVVTAHASPMATAVATPTGIVEISAMEIAEMQALALARAGFEAEAAAWFAAMKAAA